MRKWTVRAARTVLVAAAFAAAGTGIANADNTSGDQGVVSGNQIHAPLSVPINISGNPILSRVARSAGGSIGTASVVGRGSDGGSTAAGSSSPSSTHQVNSPLTVCGNAMADKQGTGAATCKGNAAVRDEPAAVGSMGLAGAPVGKATNSAQQTASDVAKDAGSTVAPGKFGAISSQDSAPMAAPVNICGNAGAAGGTATAACDGNASIRRSNQHGTSALLG